jgi:hypothetical protein
MIDRTPPEIAAYRALCVGLLGASSLCEIAKRWLRRVILKATPSAEPSIKSMFASQPQAIHLILNRRGNSRSEIRIPFAPTLIALRSQPLVRLRNRSLGSRDHGPPL